MTQLLGFTLILIVITGGLIVSGRPAVLEALPFELALIGGAAVATLLIGNSRSTALQAARGLVQAFRGPKWSRDDYTELLGVMHELVRKSRQGGMIAIEADIETPERSTLFAKAPRLLGNVQAMGLISETYRLLALDPALKKQIDQRLDEQVGEIIAERHRAVSALHMLADALPALGIVAAVLGIIKTMGVIDQSPAILGEMIAAALLGTFLGVFLAYGLIGPMANRFAQIVEEEAAYLDTIARIISADINGLAPRTAIELARSSLPMHLRPDIDLMARSLSQTRFGAEARAA